jgi:hypothetical protein
MVVVGVATVDVGAEDADAEVGVVIFGFSAVGSMVFGRCVQIHSAHAISTVQAWRRSSVTFDVTDEGRAELNAAAAPGAVWRCCQRLAAVSRL